MGTTRLKDVEGSVYMPFMVDLENLSLRPDAAILSIGAARFDPQLGIVLDTFRVDVDINDAMRHGHVDGGTIEWWLGQDKGAQEALLERKTFTLHAALAAFSRWLNYHWVAGDGEERPAIWANGTQADIVWLENAYRAVGLSVPWHYQQPRDYRTFINEVLPPERVREVMDSVEQTMGGVIKHDASEDARFQALVLCEVLRRVMGWRI